MTIAKILIVDDETKVLPLLKSNLEEYGFEVLTASTGIEGIIKATQFQPSLIILDIRMPVLDGWEVCAKLKSIPETKNIPIVFLTAFSSEKDKEKAKNLGAVEYLTKPMDPDKLFTIFLGIIYKNTLQKKGEA